MWQRCRAVAMTYFSQKIILLFLALFALIILPLFFIAQERPNQFAQQYGTLVPWLFFHADHSARGRAMLVDRDQKSVRVDLSPAVEWISIQSISTGCSCFGG